MPLWPADKPYPATVAFDLDGTIWNGWLNEYWVGQKGRVSNSIKDNIEMKENKGTMIIRDKKNKDFRCQVSSDIPKIFQDLRKKGVAIAIASRNTNKCLTNRALWMINIKDLEDGQKKPLTSLLTYNEVLDVPKTEHFKKIREGFP